MIILTLLFIIVLTILAFPLMFASGLLRKLFSTPQKKQDVQTPEEPTPKKDKLQVGDLSDVKEVDFKKQ